MPFTNKDQNDGTVIGRARANSTVQTISQANLTPIKTERGIYFCLHSNFIEFFGSFACFI